MGRMENSSRFFRPAQRPKNGGADQQAIDGNRQHCCPYCEDAPILDALSGAAYFSAA